MRFRSLSVPFLAALALLGCRSQDGGDGTADGQSAMGGAAMQHPGAEGGPSAQLPPQDPTQYLDEEAQHLARLRERSQALSTHYVELGQDRLDLSDLPGALENFSTALDIDPTNQAAREGLHRVEAYMGDDWARATEYVDGALAIERVRRQQAFMEAERHVLEGDQLVRDADYAEALSKYRTASVILGYHPVIATESLDEEILGNKIDSAMQLLEEQRREDSMRVKRESTEAREAAEEEARDMRETKLRTLYAEAFAAYERENYSRAELLANQIIAMDPGNPDAIQMREVAQEARHSKVSESNLRNMREEWIRAMEDVEVLGRPQLDPIVFDDLERWYEVSQRLPITFSEPDPVGRAEKDAIMERLNRARFSPDFGVDGEGAPLTEIAEFLQTITGVNFVISPAVGDELDEDETSIEMHLSERSVRKVLDLIALMKESLRWKVENGVVKFVTIEEMVGGQVLRMYSVHDLIHPVKDFPGREINVDPSGLVPEFDEDIEEREALVVTSDSLEALIRDNVAVESWDLDPANALRITDQGVLVVNQTPEVQEQIEKLLIDLREATGIMVDIQTRFLAVEDNFLEDIGVDFRGLGTPGEGTNEFFDDYGDPTAQATLGQEIGQDATLGFFYEESGGNGNLKGKIEELYDIDLGDEDVMTPSGGLSFQWVYLNDLEMEMILRAVSKSERVAIVTAPRLLVFNTARANLTVMNQLAYVQDFNVEIAQGASIADPIVNVVQDGVILDVRPVVSADRRFITLEVRPTVATLTRPIEEITTTLGGASSVTIQLPELEIARVRTSVPMPDGGTVMLGGMKISDTQDLRSGVPVLKDIPILSFFFERKGNYQSKRKLLILLKAGIVIPTEHEPTPAQTGAYAPASN